jgi:dTDP-4-amino-4,6-dideoxygalactose transaminase
MLAAFLLAQLESREAIQTRRRDIWNRYAAELATWTKERGITMPHVPTHCEQPHHMFYLLMKSTAQREAFITHLEKQSILAVFHYLPLNISDMGKKFGAKAGDCPVTEDISSRLVRLPFFNGLTEGEQGEVIATAKSFRG